jgi:hypothetical protein
VVLGKDGRAHKSAPHQAQAQKHHCMPRTRSCATELATLVSQRSCSWDVRCLPPLPGAAQGGAQGRVVTGQSCQDVWSASCRLAARMCEQMRACLQHVGANLSTEVWVSTNVSTNVRVSTNVSTNVSTDVRVSIDCVNGHACVNRMCQQMCQRVCQSVCQKRRSAQQTPFDTIDTWHIFLLRQHVRRSGSPNTIRNTAVKGSAAEGRDCCSSCC